MSNTVKNFGRIVSTLLVTLLVALCVTVVLPRVFGMRPFTVLSGSMEPTYPVGSLLYVTNTQPEQIKVGDPITFVLNKELAVATHRVVRIDSEKQYFYTKGDANNAEDINPVHFKNLIGKPVFAIPYLGYVSAYMSTKPGIVITITILLTLAILTFLPDIFEKLEKLEKKEKVTSNDKQE